MPAINCQDLKQMYESREYGPEGTVQHLSEALDKKELRCEDFSIKDLFESFCGTEALRRITPGKSGNYQLYEAANVVDSSAFANITGQIVFNKIKEEYTNPNFIWPDVTDTMTSTFFDGERIPGVGDIGDVMEIVDEGQPYPNVGMNEEYIDFGPAQTRGCIVPISRKMITADRTGVLLQRAAKGGHYMGINKEKRVLDTVLGVTNSYKRNGTALNTYLTSGAYINDQTSNKLVDWTNVQSAWLLLDAITDPNTGEPIMANPNVLIVPSALVMTARRIAHATATETVDLSASTNTQRFMAENPLPGHFGNITVLSNQYVKARSSSATKWWFGEPKKAFLYREIWGVETLQAASNSEAEFTQDIMFRAKVTECGQQGVLDPRFITRNDQ